MRKTSSLILMFCFALFVTSCDTNSKGQEQVSSSDKKSMTTATKIENRTYYFPPKSHSFSPNEQIMGYAEDINQYLQENKNKRLDIIGHTDSDGTPEENHLLGQKRAEAIRNYFVSQGIPSKRIFLSSNGGDTPVASNETKAGKVKNNRVDVKIK